jgi:hypothetical protein
MVRVRVDIVLCDHFYNYVRFYNYVLRRQSLGEGGLADLEATREDVVQEVLNTPRRREDNDITRLTEKMHLLQVRITNSIAYA